MIFYAGNILSKHGYTPTFIETLTPKLSEYYKIISVSDKKNQIHRMLDMIYHFFKNKKSIEVTLIDSYSMRAFWYTYILSKLCHLYHIPYIPILRGGGYPDRLKESKKDCDFIFKNSVKNISPSMYLKTHFEKENYPVEYIPNFIPLENYKFKMRSVLKPKLLWVRSFDATYNPVLAVDILKILKKKYPGAALCMVGPDKDGSLEKVKQKAVDSGVIEYIKFAGRMSKPDWIKLSEEYDIFINTTNFDNHPVSVIEAMALGIPVVSTNVGGIPFLIENGIDGLLVKPNDAEEFAVKIEKLLKDNQLSENISVNARNKAAEFDWENVKRSWFETLDPYIKKEK